MARHAEVYSRNYSLMACEFVKRVEDGDNLCRDEGIDGTYSYVTPAHEDGECEKYRPERVVEVRTVPPEGKGP